MRVWIGSRMCSVLGCQTQTPHAHSSEKRCELQVNLCSSDDCEIRRAANAGRQTPFFTHHHTQHIKQGIVALVCNKQDKLWTDLIGMFTSTTAKTVETRRGPGHRRLHVGRRADRRHLLLLQAPWEPRMPKPPAWQNLSRLEGSRGGPPRQPPPSLPGLPARLVARRRIGSAPRCAPRKALMWRRATHSPALRRPV